MGSEHDPETDLCAPSDYKDGKYIMYPWAVSGYDENNMVCKVHVLRNVDPVLAKHKYDTLQQMKGFL